MEVKSIRLRRAKLMFVGFHEPRGRGISDMTILQHKPYVAKVSTKGESGSKILHVVHSWPFLKILICLLPIFQRYKWYKSGHSPAADFSRTQDSYDFCIIDFPFFVLQTHLV